MRDSWYRFETPTLGAAESEGGGVFTNESLVRGFDAWLEALRLNSHPEMSMDVFLTCFSKLVTGTAPMIFTLLPYCRN
ncbi:MAG: hypothetical protein M3362_26545 [Acidobacteriota bacterium]|nr:hypothetical protein [Acidobacteriota bacterium]